jgi:hypothetical protein
LFLAKTRIQARISIAGQLVLPATVGGAAKRSGKEIETRYLSAGGQRMSAQKVSPHTAISAALLIFGVPRLVFYVRNLLQQQHCNVRALISVKLLYALWLAILSWIFVTTIISLERYANKILYCLLSIT